MHVKNLAGASTADQTEFFNSFDRVLSDIDGVLWVGFVPIEDAQSCLENLKKAGKPVQLVTNYAFTPAVTTHERLIENQFDFELEDIANPQMATVDYLREANFQGKIYAVASSFYKNELRREGFEVVEDPPQLIDESLGVLVQNIQDDEDVRAVVCDFDVNTTFLKIQKAITYLKRPDCLFITGGADKFLPVGKIGPLLGNYFTYQGMTEATGKKPLSLAKPSKGYMRFVTKKFKVQDPSRVLFIGDMINEDMGFAAAAGFKKLLVLSGNSSLEDLKNWNHPEEYKPDYYVESLTELNKIIKTNHKL
ncbi:unnamed protein product [Phyllotreta striolata]|uniref:4-nitrophenylphosphatase n=1 Tax=Phyllotreta striolata TaxID=444603 RepID=A0A9N9XP76_PHYSR|nr:unnamed protein product [Phyllotreta striolata]